MNLELCKFPCVHLTRFRLVQKQSATVKADTCALSLSSQEKACMYCRKMKSLAHRRKLTVNMSDVF